MDGTGNDVHGDVDTAALPAVDRSQFEVRRLPGVTMNVGTDSVGLIVISRHVSL